MWAEAEALYSSRIALKGLQRKTCPVGIAGSMHKTGERAREFWRENSSSASAS